MTEPNEQYAYFTITGEFDPTEISDLVGVSPTESWRKGDVNTKTRYERKFSRWSLYSTLGRHRSLEDHIADVLEQLRLNRVGFCEASTRFGAVIQLVAYFKTEYPGLSFDRELVKALADFSLGLDCDFYYLYSDKREDS
jgi:hypothetical protein